jgi:hypothetical protein
VMQAVCAAFTRLPTGHRLHDVAPALLLYWRLPSVEVLSHLPQTKSPPPALAVPGQFREQCRQSASSVGELSRLLQGSTTHTAGYSQKPSLTDDRQACHPTVCATS